jgi:hypothetical protein
MDSDIFFYTVGLMIARLAAVLLFGYAIFVALRGRHATACAATKLSRSSMQDATVVDERY